MPHKRTGRITDTAVMTANGAAPKIYPTGLYLRISGEEAAKGEKLNNQRDLLLSSLFWFLSFLICDLCPLATDETSFQNYINFGVSRLFLHSSGLSFHLYHVHGKFLSKQTLRACVLPYPR